MNGETIAEQFIRAGAGKTGQDLEALLGDSALLRVWNAEGVGAHRPAGLVVEEVLELCEDWIRPSLEIFRAMEQGDTGAADFRVQVQRGPQVFDQNGALFVTLQEGRVSTADLYLSKRLLSMGRTGIVRAQMTEEERDAFIRAVPYRWDLMRDLFSPNSRYRRTEGMSKVWTKLAHPGSNYIRMVHWSEDEADERIVETMEWFRERGLGIQWTVGEHDTPADLAARLVAHGFVRAGDQALMARFGIENVDDIATNPDIELIDLKQAPKELWEASLQINGTAFQWPKEQVDNEREGWFEDLQSEPIRSVMALLDGKPVADAHLYLQSGFAYLGGAATLPEFRNRKIYSTLLRRRLEIARDEGYEVALIHAEPMSRRVVSRFGFQTYAMYEVFGWMEPMDLDVIKTLVQDQ